MILAVEAKFVGDCGEVGGGGERGLSIIPAREECEHDRRIDPDDAMYTQGVDRQDILSQTQYCLVGDRPVGGETSLAIRTVAKTP